MTILKFRIALLAILISCINSFAQVPSGYNRVVKYGYDFSGNRVSRIVVYVPGNMQKSQQNNDSTNAAEEDSVSVKVDPQYLLSNETVNEEQAAATNPYYDNIGDQSIQIFPNPTSGNLQVKISPFNPDEPAEYLFFDMQGHLLLRAPCITELTRINITKYASGSYIFRIIIGGKHSEWEIIRQ